MSTVNSSNMTMTAIPLIVSLDNNKASLTPTSSMESLVDNPNTPSGSPTTTTRLPDVIRDIPPNVMVPSINVYRSTLTWHGMPASHTTSDKDDSEEGWAM